MKKLIFKQKRLKFGFPCTDCAYYIDKYSNGGERCINPKRDFENKSCYIHDKL